MAIKVELSIPLKILYKTVDFNEVSGVTFVSIILYTKVHDIVTDRIEIDGNTIRLIKVDK